MSKNESANRNSLPSLPTPMFKGTQLLNYIRYSDFKRLVGRVASELEQNKIKSVAVLSASEREGKTFLVCAMALGFALLLQKRVLIVNTVLETGENSKDLKQTYDEELRHASFRGGDGAGPQLQMIDMISPRMGEEQSDLVDFMIGNYVLEFKRHYDLVLFDTCALLTHRQRSIDPIVIAGQADASIIVASDPTMNHASLTALKTALSQWKVRTLGVIYNQARIGVPKAK